MLQLVGVACLSAAAKYEEIYPPEMSDYVYVAENAIGKQDIIQMEYTVSFCKCSLVLLEPCCFVLSEN